MARAESAKPVAATVHWFKLTLNGIRPLIRRRIELLSDASFRDLHGAIHDAMGWEDMYLHEFRIGLLHDSVRIGIPLDDGSGRFDDTCLAGGKVPIATHFAAPGARRVYLYDFGDDWSQQVRLEASLPHEAGVRYPSFQPVTLANATRQS